MTIPPASPLRHPLPHHRPPSPRQPPCGDDDGVHTQSYRLPATLQPLHYTLRIKPLIHGDQSVSGTVDIDLEVIQPTSNITVHASRMAVILKGITLEGGLGNSPIPVPSITHFSTDNVRNFFTAHLSGELGVGRAVRYSIPFVASLKNWGEGFFTFRYNDTGVERIMLASIHHPSFTRQAFPCLDEPQLKATFTLQVTRETNMTAISNMPIAETVPVEGEPGWVVDTFQKTPMMSPHHLLLVVTPFSYVEVVSKTGLPIRVWARSETLNETSYLQQVIVELLDYLETYTAMPFPLPKLDLVAVPADSPGAYGGWGLVQFYSDKKLYSATANSTDHHNYLTVLTAHQLAGQWFGGLVTPRWWSDIWLSKGFATYLHHLASAHVLPDEALVKNRPFHMMHMVMAVDSKPKCHPVHLNVKNPQTQRRMFDSITYHKASALIRMMNHFLTPDTFTKGVRSYLKTHEYGNADQDDLWEQLTQAGHEDGILDTHLNMSTIMNTWTLQPGYPVIRVVRDSTGTSATLLQERFIVVKGNRKRDRHANKWWIPVTFTNQTTPDFTDTRVQVWMSDTESQIQVNQLPSADEWVIFNVQATGFYRVNYDDNNWRLLTQQLLTNHSVIHVINRAQLIDDSLELALAGDLDYKTALDVSAYLSQEDEPLPWETFKKNVKRIKGLLHNTPALGALRKYVLSLLVPIYSKFDLGSPKDIRKIQKTHATVVSLACSMGHANCVDLAKTLYSQWMDDQGKIQSIPLELRDVVFCTAIAYGGEAEWNFAMEQYTAATDQEYKKQLLRAMGCKREPATGAGTDGITEDEAAAGTTDGTTGEATGETTESTVDEMTSEATEGTPSETTLGTTVGTRDGSSGGATTEAIGGTIAGTTDGTTEGTVGGTADRTTGGTAGETGTVGGFRDEAGPGVVESRPEGENQYHSAWTTITSRWTDLSPILGGDEAGVEQLVLSATESFNTQQDIDEIENFRDAHLDDPAVVRASESALRRAKFNLALREQYSAVISEWLQDLGFLH